LVLSITLTFIPQPLGATNLNIVSAQSGIASDCGLLLAVLRIRDIWTRIFSIPDPHQNI
jgi:hypothetical protein